MELFNWPKIGDCNMRQLYYRVLVKNHSDEILETHDVDAPFLADVLDFCVERYGAQRIKDEYIHFDLLPYLR